MEELQLLCDVETRWSSMLLMIECVIILCEVSCDLKLWLHTYQIYTGYQEILVKRRFPRASQVCSEQPWMGCSQCLLQDTFGMLHWHLFENLHVVYVLCNRYRMYFNSGCHQKRLPRCVLQFHHFTLWWQHGTSRLRTCLSFILWFKQVFRSSSHTRLVWPLFQHMSSPWVRNEHSLLSLSKSNDIWLNFTSLAINPTIKLDWYSQYVLERVLEMKQLFIDKVSHFICQRVCWLIITCIKILQLCPYHTQSSSPAQCTPPTMEDDWVDTLLGFRRIHQQTGNRMLESEVDAYLLDMGVGSNVLTYWQVSGWYFEVGSMIGSNLFLGELRALPNNLFTCNGHPSHSRLCCTLRESFLIK